MPPSLASKLAETNKTNAVNNPNRNGEVDRTGNVIRFNDELATIVMKISELAADEPITSSRLVIAKLAKFKNGPDRRGRPGCLGQRDQ